MSLGRQRMPDLVIFDCDGILVDSEPIANRVLSEILAEHGSGLSPEACAATFRGTNRHAVEAYMTARGLPLTERWADLYYQQSFEAFRRELRPIEGVPEMLERLRHDGVSFCVASNGTAEKMAVSLEVCGLIGLLRGRVFSAYDVGRSKPAPDVFLHAAERHGADPGACIVVEDSATGLEAAARAGMQALAYVPEGEAPPEDLFGARMFAAMQYLPGLLGPGGEGRGP